MAPESDRSKSAGNGASLEVPGGRLEYEVAGSGPAIAFIHAGIADRRMWGREFTSLSQGHTVVRYDRRGFGRSPAAAAPYSEVADLRALVGHLRVESLTLVGCSNGGAIALDFAVEHPRLLRALLLVAPGVSGFDGSTDPEGKPDYDADGLRLKPAFQAWGDGRKDEALRQLRGYWCSMQKGASLDLVDRMLHENAHEIFTDTSAAHVQAVDPPALQRLKSIRVPTTVLYGDHDEPTGGWIARRIAKEIPGAVYVPVAGADHLVNLSRPDAFDDALRRLLR